MVYYYIISLIIGIIIGVVAFLVYYHLKMQNAKQQIANMHSEAEQEIKAKGQTWLLEVKEKWFSEKDKIEKSLFKEKENLQNLEKNLLQQQSKLERKQDFINRDREQLTRKDRSLRLYPSRSRKQKRSTGCLLLRLWRGLRRYQD